MKNTKKRLNKFLSVFLALTIVFSMFSGLGLTASAAISHTGKTADVSTMDSWRDLFPADNTNQAGRIWTDKSVFTNADAFQNLKDVNGRDVDIEMTDADDNFLVALSALASNKSIVGYSYTPTDTMLILDASASMRSSSYVDDLVTAANDAMAELLALNRHNRVGVVLYSGNTVNGDSSGDTATVLLPLDRYTQYYEGTETIDPPGPNNNYEQEVVEENIFLVNDGQDSISVNRGVQNKEQQNTEKYMAQTKKNVAGGTYMQNGVYMAMEEFLDVEDTVIPDGQHQAGTTRTPIFVLMSDGEPTTATTYINGRSGNNQTGIGTSNLGDGREIGDEVLYDVVDFVNQLTAANAKVQVDAHYEDTTPLFYTLGIGANNQPLNSSVLNPSGFTNTDKLWNGYIRTAKDSNFITDIEEEDWQGRADQGSIAKLDTITSVDQKNYVTEHFRASDADGLIEAFDDVVNQIIIQSLYYPTLVDNGDFDHDGYIEFIDDIGHYMDVKDIKGITIGDTLFTGERLAANFTPSGGDLINPDGSYSEMGDNMVWSVMDRLGIATAQDARDLINSAYEAGQLRYNEQTGEWSNYIGWYADDAGNFLGHWHEGHTAADKPARATYINKSYGMLGEVKDEHAATDMMYVSTQVHTHISDGNVSFIWRVPASLIPVVSYNITLNGETIKDSTVANIEYDAAEPIRIIFEVGLIDEITAVNLNEMVTDPTEHIIDENNDKISDDGKYYFYTNWWSDDKLSHENPSKTEDTIVFFEPSIQNERYYYSEETAVYVNTGSDENPVYTRYSGVMPTATDGNTYYREYAVFVGSSIEFWYEEMSADTISVLKAENRNADGTWDIPMGTVHRVLEPYNLEKEDKTLTATLDYVRYPVIEEIPEKDSFYIGSLLGNNGRIAVDIPQGIKISKVVDETLYGTDEAFEFIVEAMGVSGELEAYKESVNGKLTYEPVVFYASQATVSMKAGESVYILGIEQDVNCKVMEEINGDYKVSSIKVNGVAQDTTDVADVTVEQYTLSEVVFENTFDVDDNTIVVSKEIVHDSGLTYNADQEYTFEFYNKATPNDKQTFTIKSDETKTFSGLEDGTYIVNEINIPTGYAPRNNNIEVEVSDDAVVPVHFINDYTPAHVKPAITVSGTKTLDGRDWKEGDSFSFKLQRLVGANWEDIAERTVAYGDSDYDYMFDFANDADLVDVALTTVGTHYFRIFEDVPTEKLGGVTYDEAYRYFNVVVADDKMDGYLEISSVVATAPVTVNSTGSDANKVWNVDADFTNNYAAIGTDDIVITIDKGVADPVGSGIGRDGFTFGLYTVGGTTPIMESEPTGENGRTSFNLTFPATSVGRTYNFEIREIVPEDKLEGMIYVETPVPVTIEIVDQLDGTVKAEVVADTGNLEGIEVYFVNIYDPADAEVILSGTKVMEGRDFDANEFTFELYEDGNAVPKLATNDAKANGGTFKFEKLTFDAIGTYNYTIAEKRGTLGGVSYSGKVYDVQIIVTDDTDNDGTLNAEVKIDGATVAADAITGAVVFENIYNADSVDVTLEATKTLDGRDLQDGEFNFALKDVDNDTVVQDDATNDVDGKVVFDALPFDAAGTYNYVVYENEVDGNGITVDKTEYAVIITVTDNGAGKLLAEVKVGGAVVTGSTANVITFNNDYSAASVDVVLEATKTLTGRNTALGDKEFEFALKDVDNNKVVQDNATNDANGKVVFDALTFDKAGTYNYVVYENEVDANGITVDKTQHTVTIVVSDNNNGQLVATVNGTAVAGNPINVGAFNNTYKAANTNVTIEATKTLEGRDLRDGEFKFDLYDVDGDKVLQNDVALVLKSDGTGIITFQNLTFDKEGTYKYKVYEDELSKNGVTADTTEYNVTIVVTDNNSGQLNATVKVDNSDVAGSTAGTIVFRNVYNAASVDVTLEATKELVGRVLVEGEFKFAVKNVDTDTVVQDDAANDIDGKVVFDTMTFDAAGNYNYIVYENEVDANGVTVDTTVYEVTIVITDNGEGQLEAAVYVDGKAVADTTADEITFRNVYKAGAIDIVIDAIKTLDGRELSDDEFTFELYLDGKVIATAKNDKDGKIAFENYAIDAAGEYVFEVKEVKGDAKGITYDETVYTVKVIVTDNLDGTFTLEYVYSDKDGDVDELVFENKYTPEPQPEPTPEPQPEPESPKTGDSTNLAAWLAVVFISGVMIFATGKKLRRLSK